MPFDLTLIEDLTRTHAYTHRSEKVMGMRFWLQFLKRGSERAGEENKRKHKIESAGCETSIREK